MKAPKEGRWAFEVNRGMTLRPLICNVSGYMKPGEAPGQVFNYQTNGMCVLSHCIEKAYGLYDVNRPEESPKISPLYKEKIADVIGADWEYSSRSQQMHDKARTSTSSAGVQRFSPVYERWHVWGGSGVTGAFGTEGP